MVTIVIPTHWKVDCCNTATPGSATTKVHFKPGHPLLSDQTHCPLFISTFLASLPKLLHGNHRPDGAAFSSWSGDRWMSVMKLWHSLSSQAHVCTQLHPRQALSWRQLRCLPSSWWMSVGLFYPECSGSDLKTSVTLCFSSNVWSVSKNAQITGIWIFQEFSAEKGSVSLSWIYLKVKTQ